MSSTESSLNCFRHASCRLVSPLTRDRGRRRAAHHLWAAGIVTAFNGARKDWVASHSSQGPWETQRSELVIFWHWKGFPTLPLHVFVICHLPGSPLQTITPAPRARDGTRPGRRGGTPLDEGEEAHGGGLVRGAQLPLARRNVLLQGLLHHRHLLADFQEALCARGGPAVTLSLEGRESQPHPGSPRVWLTIRVALVQYCQFAALPGASSAALGDKTMKCADANNYRPSLNGTPLRGVGLLTCATPAVCPPTSPKNSAIFGWLKLVQKVTSEKCISLFKNCWEYVWIFTPPPQRNRKKLHFWGGARPAWEEGLWTCMHEPGHFGGWPPLCTCQLG